MYSFENIIYFVEIVTVKGVCMR